MSEMGLGRVKIANWPLTPGPIKRMFANPDENADWCQSPLAGSALRAYVRSRSQAPFCPVPITSGLLQQTDIQSPSACLKGAIYGQPSHHHLTASHQAAVLSFSNAELFRWLSSRSPDAAC